MKFLKKDYVLIVPLFFGCASLAFSQDYPEDLGIGQNHEWLISNFIENTYEDVEISGNPRIIDSPYGNAVNFDGVGDAIFLDANALEALEEFTIEMIFNPATDGNFEQRVVHIGEVSGDRMLLEIRALNGNWYFDGFVASEESKLALIDEKLLHPLGLWYHVAFVVEKDRLSTYVNGKLELSEAFSFNGINTGQSSIGVRLNKRSWFKGAIYKIKISPSMLNPDGFIPF